MLPLIAIWAQPAQAVTNADVTINMISSPLLTVDSNNCAGGDGPHNAYVGFEVTNISGGTLTDLEIALSALDTANGFDLAGGQAASLFLGSLGASESRARYWYIQYPCTEPLTDSITVTLSDATAFSASLSADITTDSQISAAAGGNVESSFLGAGAVLGQLIEMDVTYSFGSLGANNEVVLQPAGNSNFDAGCLQLERTKILSSQVNGLAINTVDQIYFIVNKTTGTDHVVEVRYSFRYQCAGVTTVAAPYAAATSGGALKYTGNFETQTPINYPSASIAFDVTKTVDSFVGGIATYTVTLSNSSSFAATVDSIVDTLPAGVTFNAIEAGSDITAANSSSVPQNGDSGTLTWDGIPTISYEIPAGGSLDLIYSTTIPAIDGGYVNAVSLTSGSVIAATSGATVTVGGYASLGAAKDMNFSGAGPWTVSIDYVVENFGNVEVTGLTMPDDLEAVFGTEGTDWTLTAISKLSGPATFAENSGFTGKAAGTELIAADSSLLPGESGRIRVSLSLGNKGATGLFTNQVTVSGSSTAGAVSDDSTEGLDPDADGDSTDGTFDSDGLPNESTASTVSVENPAVGVAKDMNAVSIGGGKYTVTIDYYLENLGDVTVGTLSMPDDLETVFGAAGVTWTFTSAAKISGPATFAENTAFNGSTDSELIATGSSLAVGETAQIQVVIDITTLSATGNYENSVTLTGESPGNATPGTANVSDVSMRGTNPDPDGDGDPSGANEDFPTLLLLGNNPVIGVAKAAGTVADNGDGSFDVPFTVTVENLGNVGLNTIQVTDDLEAAFPSPATFTVTAPVATGLAANASYDGLTAGDTNLLGGSDTLAAGAVATITFTATVTPGGAGTAFTNRAQVTALFGGGATAVSVSDLSTNGLDPDPNGNGQPADAGESDATPISLTPTPVIGAAKQAGTVTDNGDGTYSLPFTITLENLGSTTMLSVQVTDDLDATFPAPATFSVSGLAATGGLTVNTGFNGITDTNLLAGTDSLTAAATATITFTATVDPNGGSGPYSNQASVNAVDAEGTAASDLSTPGTDPDPDGDGDPAGAGEDAATSFTFTETAILGVAKAAGATVDNGDGTFSVPFTLTLENLGNVDVNAVQVTDDLTAAFPAPVTASVSGLSATGGLTVNASFNGNADRNLLAGTNTLAPGAVATITFTVTFDPNGETGPFTNTANAAGSSPGGTALSDASTDGADPDPNGDGNPDEAVATSGITFTESAVLGVAKAAGATVDNGDGTFSVPFTLTLENLGNVDVNAVQVTDDLTAAFPAPVTASVSGLSATGGLTVNASFNGNADRNLLAGTNTLAPGAVATITFTATFDPNGETGPFTNSATATGTSPGGTALFDASTDGADPDVDGNDLDGTVDNDGTPDEAVGTSISFTETPVLGVAKAAGATVDNGDGTFSVPFTLTVENLGTVDVESLQVTDDLTATFTGTSTYSVSTAPASGTLTANAAFNGNADRNLLASTDTLAPGATATITFTVTFDSNGETGPFTNTANAAGSSPGGTALSDASTDGADPDADGNDLDGTVDNDGTPDEAVATTISFTETPVLGVAKAAGATVDNGDGTFSVPFTLTVENLGTVDVNAVQATDDLTAAFPAPVTASVSGLSATGGLTVNAAFDGDVDQNLLAGADVLAPAATATISFTVTFDPNGETGPFTNTANAAGSSPGGAALSDASTDGADPDADGNDLDGTVDNDGDPGENTATSIAFTETAILGVAKAAGATVDNGDGTFSVPFTLTVENLGTVDVNAVQVTDDLTATFPAPVTASVSGLSATGGLTVNGAFDGDVDQNLLAGADVLAPAATATITFTVTFDPNGETGPFTNSATATGTSPGGTALSDASVPGTNPDPDGDGDPAGVGEDVASSISFDPAVLSGSVSVAESGWIVELVIDGVVVATTVTDTNGDYSFADLSPGGPYSVQVRDPATGMLYDRTAEFYLSPGVTSAAPLLGIDPSGVVYDAITRAPVPGVAVTMTDAGGTALPAACFVDPAQQGQVTLATGVFRFDVLAGADALCPAAENEYRLQISAPAPYLSVASSAIPPQAGALQATGCAIDAVPGGDCEVVANATAPLGADPTTYYMSFLLESGDPNVVHNHIPLDPPSGGGGVAITKTTPRTEVIRGDLVPYQITLTNSLATDLSGVAVIDDIPAGFKYMTGSARLDGVATEPAVAGRELSWTGLLLPASGTLTVDLVLGVGSGVSEGTHTNFARAIDGGSGAAISETASASVLVTADPMFDCTTVIGTVFDDRNRNGYRDEGEPGLPGVRIATARGLLITTDAHGRYHVACAAIPNEERGSNFILKVDVRTLPAGYSPTSENPRVVRLTRGKAVRANFGVALEEKTVSQSDAATWAQADTGLSPSGQDTPADKILRELADDSWRQIVLGHQSHETKTETPASAADTPPAAPAPLPDPAPTSQSAPALDVPEAEPALDIAEPAPVIDPSPIEAAPALSAPPAVPVETTVRGEADVMPAGNGLQLSFDGLKAVPVLNVTAWPEMAVRGEPVTFTPYWNYSAWIERAEVRIFAADRSIEGRPLAVLPVENGGAQWAPDAETGDRVQYVLRVYDGNGRFDETVSMPLEVGNVSHGADKDADPATQGLAGYGVNRMGRRAILVTGGTATVNGASIAEGQRVSFMGRAVSVDSEGRFVAQEILPVGDSLVAVEIRDESGKGTRYERRVNIPDSEWFYVAMADLTVGAQDYDGPAEMEANAGEFENVYVDGRLAFYVKGKIKGQWLLTASMDTGEESVEDMFGTLDEKDPRRLLRRIDPDRYYPVYGDDSTTVDDAPTSGKFYVRLERGKSHVMWGNFQARIDGGDLAQIDRSAYGGKLHYESDGVTGFGEARTQVDGFAAEPGSLPARDEFRGTGGSLYFLRRMDIVQGSELLRVEIRDADTGLVLQTHDLRALEDYDIDPIQGRIMLSHPLPSTADDSDLVRAGPLSGNPVFLVARYEYLPGLGDFDEFAAGGRVSQWFGDYVQAGVTASRQGADQNKQQLEAADLTLRYAAGTYLKGQTARTAGPGYGAAGSADGGFTFDPLDQDLSPDVEARAHRVEGAIAFSEITDSEWDGTLTAYVQRREAGFSAPGQLTALQTDQWGVEFEAPIGKSTSVTAAHDEHAEVGGRESRTSQLGVTQKIGDHVEIGVGAKHDDQTPPAAAIDAESGKRTDVAGEVKYTGDGDWEARVFAQGTAAKDDERSRNNRFGAGGSVQLTEKLKVTGEASDGDGGAGGRLGAEYQFTDRSQFYLGYQIDGDRTTTGTGTASGTSSSGGGALVAGNRTRYTDQTTVYGEERITHEGDGVTGYTHAYGVDHKPAEGWTVGASVERGSVETENGDLERTAVAVSAGFGDKQVKWYSALEARFEDSVDGERSTYFTRNSLGLQLNDDWRLIGRANMAFSDSDQGDFYNADFAEASIGFAYRPVDNDWLSALAKYTYFQDLPPAEQLSGTGTAAVPGQRSHIAMFDATIQVNNWLSVGGAYGLRMSELDFTRGPGDSVSSTAHFGALRTDIHVVNNWDILVEGRVLHIEELQDTRAGALIGVYRHFGDNTKVGLGYNFTDFSDDLTDMSYGSQGVFLNVIAKF